MVTFRGFYVGFRLLVFCYPLVRFFRHGHGVLFCRVDPLYFLRGVGRWFVGLGWVNFVTVLFVSAVVYDLRLFNSGW